MMIFLESVLSKTKSKNVIEVASRVLEKINSLAVSEANGIYIVGFFDFLKTGFSR